MSLIVFKDDVMVSDGMIVSGWSIHSQNFKKIGRASDGSLFGIVGYPARGLACVRAIESVRAKDIADAYHWEKLKLGDNETTILWIKPNRNIITLTYVGPEFSPRSVKYHAIGCGSDVALGAMDMGASAIEALKLAAKRNMGVGHRVFSMYLRPR